MIIKITNDKKDLEQIYKMNYSTFVEEIPQHNEKDNKILIDKFNHKNTYFVAKKGDRVVGMISYNSERPFSLDQKLENLDNLLPSGYKIVEVRLFAVDPLERRSFIAYRLLQELCKHLIKIGYNLCIVSGTVRELKMYNKMGLKPFGPIVGTKEAQYQPMYVTFEGLRNDFKAN